MSSEREVTITWLGHATVRLESPQGESILIDPWIQNNPAVPEAEKQSGKVDLMLISHGHADAMGDAVQIAGDTGCDVLAQKEICDWLTLRGVANCVGMNVGGTYRWNGIRITQTAAVHSSSVGEGADAKYGGLAVGYVIQFANGFTVYHACDTALFGDMRLIGSLYNPDVAILPIGDHFTMGPREAAEAVKLVQAPAVIPVHFGTFPVLTGTPRELSSALSGNDGVKVIALQPGGSVRQSELV